MRRERWLLVIATAGFVAALLVAWAWAQPPGGALGPALYTHGFTTTIAPGDTYFSDGALVHGTFNPNAPSWPPQPGGDVPRYGWPAHTKGHMVGPEGTSQAEVQRAVDAGCWPFASLGLPAGYQVSYQDYLDALDVDNHQGSSIYNSIANCAAVRPRPSPTPRPSPSPTSTPPVVDVTPTPVPPVATPTPVVPQCAPAHPLIPPPDCVKVILALAAKSSPSLLVFGHDRAAGLQSCRDWLALQQSQAWVYSTVSTGTAGQCVVLP